MFNRCTKTIDIDNQIIFRNTIIIISRSKLRIVSEFSFENFYSLFFTYKHIIWVSIYIYFSIFQYYSLSFIYLVYGMFSCHIPYSIPYRGPKYYIQNFIYILYMDWISYSHYSLVSIFQISKINSQSG